MTARRTRGAAAVVARESLPLVVCSAFLGMLAVLVPQLLSSDGWLALVAGRLIAHDGLPRHDTLAALTSGREWIDQQWLGQLAAYGAASLGGIRLVVAANVLLVAGAFVFAVAFARRRGAEPATVAVVALLGLLPFLVTAMNVRTQSLAYLPFVGLVAILARERAVGSGAAVAMLVLVALWGNVHGSALLAAALVALRGVEELRSHRRGAAAWLLVLGPWPALLVSPYHVHLVSYYARTAFNPSFASYLSQWAPTTFSPISAPLLLLLFAAVFSLGRAAGAYAPYERWLLGVAVLLGLLAVRNWAFAVLLLTMLAPIGLDRALRRRAARPAPAVGAVIGAVAGVAAVVGLVGALAGADLTRSYPVAAGNAAARSATGNGGSVYGGIKFADWLLWYHPELAGKVVFDVRYELLHASEVRRLVLFDGGSGVDRPLGRPSAYVLDPDVEKHAIQGLRPDVRTVYKTDHAVVAVVRHAG